MNGFPIPDAALARHIAVLGETGSGKTHNSKAIIEHLVAEGYRVCVLDTIKSDWWGVISSASGKRPGLPFKILGGPRGHVPLHAGAGKAIGELVGNGKLPLSIIDMADFGPGDPQAFFVEFAKSLWKNIKGVTYLVIEEAHEIAPKERAGFGKENMAVYWAKRLATGSRTKGIRLVVASQRTQAVHNAVLGSCGTMVAHSLTFPADQKPVREWLDHNVRDKEIIKAIKDDIAFLPTGTAWVCCAKENFFEKIKFPKIATFDNTATPDKDAGDIHVATAAVDQSELRAIIGDAVKEAEANDPKFLNAEIARLRGELAKVSKSISSTSKVVEKIDTPAKADLEAAERRGYERGHDEGGDKILAAVASLASDLAQSIGHAETACADAKTLLSSFSGFIDTQKDARLDKRRASPKNTPVAQRSEHATTGKPPGPGASRVAGSNPAGGSKLPTPQQRILNALATWLSMGNANPVNAQVAWLAGYSPSSTGFTNPRSALRTAGLIEYPMPDHVSITDDGLALAQPVEITGSLLDFVAGQLSGPEARILRAAASIYPQAATNEEVASKAGYSQSSTGYTNPRSSLRTKDLITYPASGQVRAADWLFPEGR